MRSYLTERNLVRASLVGVPITLAAVPRLIDGGYRLGQSLPVLLTGMILVAGAATAWGERAGLPGLFPARPRILRWSAVAVVLALLLMPLAFWIDQTLRGAVAALGVPELMRLNYPEGAKPVLAVLLWTGGFGTMFLHIAPLCVFARLTNNLRASILCTVALRVGIMALHLAKEGVGAAVPLFLVSAAGSAALCCWLFARGGLLPATLFLVVQEARLLLGC